MTRRSRSAAFLSATTLLAGAALSLALAPSAAADIPTPPLGLLHADPAAPTAGDSVLISGTGCFTLASSRPGATGAAATDATPAAAPSAAADDPAAGTVQIVITGPDSFRSTSTATASDDGTWAADQGITVGDAGDYTVDATCTLTDPILGQQVGFDYDSLPLEVSAPPQVVDPVVTCNGCSNSNPGDSVTIGGTGFPANTTATVTLAGYTTQTSAVDDGGGFDPVSFLIRADQAAGTLAGTVSAPGADPVSFSVTVSAVEQPPGSQDGDVPGDPTTTTTSGPTGGDTTTTGGTDTSGTTVGTSAPTLPQTGIDSVWPGVIGGLLVLAGGGLLWAGRRRDEVGAAA